MALGMFRDISSLSFDHLKRSDLLVIQASVRDRQERYRVLEKLESYLLRVNTNKIDEERLFILGVQFSSIWPTEFRSELRDRLRARIDGNATSAFLRGFEYSIVHSPSSKSYTPKKWELDTLSRRIEVEPPRSLRPQIEQLLVRYRDSTERYGDSAILVRALEQMGLALLRNPPTGDAADAAEIAAGLASESVYLNPRLPSLWILWAKALVRVGAVTAAELVLWEASRLHPDRPSILTRLSYSIARIRERLPEAIALARDAVARFPQAKGSRIVLARLLHWTRTGANESEAVQLLVNLIDKNRSDYRSISLLAKISVESSQEPHGVPIEAVISKLPHDPKTIGHLGYHINNIDPGSKLAEYIFRFVIQRFPDNSYAPNQLVRVLKARNDPNLTEEIISVLRTARARRPEDTFTSNNLAATLARAGSPDYAHEAINILQNMISGGTSDEFTKQLLDSLVRGEPGLSSSDRVGELSRDVDSEDDEIEFASTRIDKVDDIARIPTGLAQQGQLRRIRFLLENGPESQKVDAERELREFLSQDRVPAYARILAVRHGIWEGRGEELPSFALAFESALRREDLEVLRDLERQYPRLDALILIARSLFGDADAGEHIKQALAKPQKELHPAIVALKRVLGGELQAMSDNTKLLVWLRKEKARVVTSLRDSVEMMVERQRIAA